jgi:hypothetical protein
MARDESQIFPDYPKKNPGFSQNFGGNPGFSQKRLGKSQNPGQVVFRPV